VRTTLRLVALAIVCAFGPAAAWLHVETPRARPITVARIVTMAAVPADRAQLEMDADLLALVAWSEDVRAPEAVMWTVVNRARRAGTPIITEVFRPWQYHGLARGDPRAWRRARSDRAELARFRRLARLILEGRRADPTRGATHFHAADSPAPPWAPPPRAWAHRGSSLFYRAVPASR